MKINSRRACLLLMLLLPAFAVATSTGCIRQMAQLMYVIKGHEIPAKYSGLKGQRVAIVCVSDQTAYGPDTLTFTVSKYVSVKLQQGVKDIEVISPPKVDSWVDQNGWDPDSVVALGQDLKADKVLVIEIGSYSIHEGATIFKGNADVSTTVYDITKDGQVVFVHGPEPFSFPKNGRPAIHSTDRQFEAFYLARLTDHLSRLFVPHDKMDSFAEDAMQF